MYFGRDVESVRVHTDAAATRSAEYLNALAYTTGSHIVFRHGHFTPSTPEGKRLLAHELAHVMQQRSSPATRTASSVELDASGDPFEREADAVADRLGLGEPPGWAAASRVGAVPAIQRSIADDVGAVVVGAGAGVAETVTSLASSAWEQTKAAASGAWQGTKAVASAAWREAKVVAAAVAECAAWGGGVGARLLTGEFTTVWDLLGIPAVPARSPEGLRAVLRAFRHPCVRALAGPFYSPALVTELEKLAPLVIGIWYLLQNPERLFDPVREAVGEMIAQVPSAASMLISMALPDVARMQRHMEGIWFYLKAAVEDLGRNWWQTLKDSAWDLLWPLPGVKEDFEKMFETGAATVDHVTASKWSQAVDDVLAIWRLFNSILGRLYGWLFILSIIIGAVLGGVFGLGAGAIPGAAAGAEFALALGEALVISTAAAEGASIYKAMYDLTYAEQSPEGEIEDYQQIAQSSIALAILGIMLALGALAARFARGVMARLGPVLRRTRLGRYIESARLRRSVRGEPREPTRIPEGGEAPEGRRTREERARERRGGEPNDVPPELAGVCSIGSLLCRGGIPREIRAEVESYPHSDWVPEPRGEVRLRGTTDADYLDLRSITTRQLRRIYLDHPEIWTDEFRQAMNAARAAGREWPIDANGKAWEVHHQQPLDFGGTNAHPNLAAIPRDVHQGLTNWWRSVKRAFSRRFTDAQWRQLIGGSRSEVFVPR